MRAQSLSIVWWPLGSCVLCQTVFVIRTCCFVSSAVYGELMLVPAWELGVVLDRGCNEILVRVGELFP